MSKHVLIIGGMGPQASIHAHKRLIEKAHDFSNSHKENADYPRVTHISVNVEDFISDSTKKQEAEAYLLECLSEINMSSVDTGFIACNTAHLLYNQIQAATDNKLVSLVESTISALDCKKVGIVATPSTINTNLYANTSNKNIEIVLPTPESMIKIETIIRSVIDGNSLDSLTNTLQKEIDTLINNGAEKVILGCTELSMFNSYLDQDTIIDPIEITLDKILSE